jgi:hypothetical protein
MRKQLLVALLASQLSLLAAGQGGHAEDKDTGGIRSALELYISPDPAKVREAFYQTADLYSVSDKGELRIIPLEQFLGNIAKGVAAGQPRPTMSIDFIDHVGSAATARVTEVSDVARVTDYFSLVRNATGCTVTQNVRLSSLPVLLVAQSEDELKTKEEPPASDAIGSGIAGKSSATVVVEVRILETPARYVV